MILDPEEWDIKQTQIPLAFRISSNYDSFVDYHNYVRPIFYLREARLVNGQFFSEDKFVESH